MLLCFVCYKTDVWKNSSKIKYEKLNYLFEIKKLNEIALGKGVFVTIKGQRYLTKGHLKAEYPPSLEVVFDNFKKSTF